MTSSRRIVVAMVLALAVAGAVVVLLHRDDSRPTVSPPRAATAAAPRTPAPRSGLSPRKGEDRIRGVVVENLRGCRVDGPCILRVLSDGQTQTVVYHYGETPFCRNAVAANAGQEVAVGQRVEVAARYQRFERKSVLSTCDSRSYYIRAVP